MLKLAIFIPEARFLSLNTNFAFCWYELLFEAPISSHITALKHDVLRPYLPSDTLCLPVDAAHFQSVAS